MVPVVIKHQELWNISDDTHSNKPIKCMHNIVETLEGKLAINITPILPKVFVQLLEKCGQMKVRAEIKYSRGKKDCCAQRYSIMLPSLFLVNIYTSKRVYDTGVGGLLRFEKNLF